MIILRTYTTSRILMSVLSINFLSLLLGIFVFQLSLSADNSPPEATAILQPADYALIGETIDLILTFEHAPDLEFDWPKVDTTVLPKAIELRELAKPDSIFQDGRVKWSRKYQISSFEVGKHQVPAFRFTYSSNGKQGQVGTKALGLSISLPDLNPEEDIKPIKPPLEVPFGWQDVKDILLSNIALAIYGLLLMGFIYFRWFRKESETAEHVVVAERSSSPEIVLPPYEMAMGQLSSMSLQKSWSNLSPKAYYTELTDVLRHYLSARFEIDAAEMTSSEILKSLGSIAVSTDLETDIREVLQLSDLVKFAKTTPKEERMRADYDRMRNFVEQTKPERSSEEEQAHDEGQDQNQNQ